MPFREIVMQTGGTDADGNSEEGGEHFEMSVVFKGRRLKKWSASVKKFFFAISREWRGLFDGFCSKNKGDKLDG